MTAEVIFSVVKWLPVEGAVLCWQPFCKGCKMKGTVVLLPRWYLCDWFLTRSPTGCSTNHLGMTASVAARGGKDRTRPVPSKEYLCPFFLAVRYAWNSVPEYGPCAVSSTFSHLPPQKVPFLWSLSLNLLVFTATARQPQYAYYCIGVYFPLLPLRLFFPPPFLLLSPTLLKCRLMCKLLGIAVFFLLWFLNNPTFIDSAV